MKQNTIHNIEISGYMAYKPEIDLSQNEKQTKSCAHLVVRNSLVNGHFCPRFLNIMALGKHAKLVEHLNFEEGCNVFIKATLVSKPILNEETGKTEYEDTFIVKHIEKLSFLEAFSRAKAFLRAA